MVFDPDAYLKNAGTDTFDPDAYLADTSPSVTFNPDAYLEKTSSPDSFNPDNYLQTTARPPVSQAAPEPIPSVFQGSYQGPELARAMETPELAAATGRIQMAAPVNMEDLPQSRVAAEETAAAVQQRELYQQREAMKSRIADTENGDERARLIGRLQEMESGVSPEQRRFEAAQLGAVQMAEALPAYMIMPGGSATGLAGKVVDSGVRMGAVGAVQGLTEENPVEGAIKQGLSGFLTGVGFGLAGGLPGGAAVQIPTTMMVMMKADMAQGQTLEDAFMNAAAVTIMGQSMRGSEPRPKAVPLSSERGMQLSQQGDLPKTRVYRDSPVKDVVAAARGGDRVALKIMIERSRGGDTGMRDAMREVFIKTGVVSESPVTAPAAPTERPAATAGPVLALNPPAAPVVRGRQPGPPQGPFSMPGAVTVSQPNIEGGVTRGVQEEGQGQGQVVPAEVRPPDGPPPPAAATPPVTTTRDSAPAPLDVEGQKPISEPVVSQKPVVTPTPEGTKVQMQEPPAAEMMTPEEYGDMESRVRKIYDEMPSLIKTESEKSLEFKEQMLSGELKKAIDRSFTQGGVVKIRRSRGPIRTAEDLRNELSGIRAELDEMRKTRSEQSQAIQQKAWERAQLETPDAVRLGIVYMGEIDGRPAVINTLTDTHKYRISKAVKNLKPVSSSAVDAYGIKLPEGYVREGDHYMFKGEAAQAIAPSDVGAGPRVGPTEGASVQGMDSSEGSSRAAPMAAAGIDDGPAQNQLVPGYQSGAASGLPAADDVSYTIFPIKMPEITDFAVQLAGGMRYPKVRETLRSLRGLAAGVFHGRQSDSYIEMRGDLFKVINDKEIEAIRARATQEVSASFQKVPGGPDLPQAIHERMRSDIQALMEQRVKDNPGYAAKVLAHEVGHWVDYIPEHEWSRGNILGHIAGLHKYTKQMLAPLDTPDNPLSPKDRRLLRRQAEQQVGMRPKKDATVELKAWRDEVSKVYGELVEAEAGRRGLVTRSALLKELEPLIAWWNGSETMPDYYSKPEEMYADAFSALVNNPMAVASRAPIFWKMWNEYLHKRPEAARLWKKYQDDSTLGNIQGERDRRQAEQFLKADEHYEKTLLNRFNLTFKEKWDAVSSVIFAKSFPLRRRADQARMKGDPAQKAIQDYLYRHSSEQAYLMSVSNEVGRPVFVDAGIAPVEWYMYLQNRHIADNRYNIASMLGMDAVSAAQSLAEQKIRLGDDRFAVMERALASWFEIRKKYIINNPSVRRALSPELLQVMEERSTYTRVAAVNLEEDPMRALFEGSFGGQVSSRLYGQKGFLGTARNPWAATIEQEIAIMNMGRRNDVALTMRDVLMELNDPLFRDAKMTFDRNRNRQIPVLGKNERAETIPYLENGKPGAYWAPSAVTEFIDSSDAVTQQIWGNVVRVGLRDLKLWFTAWNYGFPIFNGPRDIEAWAKKLPGFKGRFLGKYSFMSYRSRANEAARSILDGKPNETAQMFLDRNMSMVFPQGLRPSDQGFWGMILGQKQTSSMSRLADAYRIKPELLGMDRTTGRKAWERIRDKYQRPNAIQELRTKIAAMMYLDERYPNMTEVEKQRLVHMMGGSPNFPDKPGGINVADALMPFYGPWVRGLESEYRAFKNEKIRYLLDTFRFSIIPKLLMFGIASGMIRYLIGDKLADELNQIYMRIPEGDKTSYTIPFAWWDPTDPNKEKVVYPRFPKDEGNRIVGGLFWKLLNDAPAEDIFSFSGGQLPGINPILSTGMAWTEYLGGRNPGRGIMTETERISGTADAAMWRYTANQLGAGLVYRFPRESLYEPPTTPLERFLRLPIISNTLGRVLKVSDKGMHERILKTVQPIEDQKAKVREQAKRALKAFVKTGSLTQEDASRMALGYAALYRADPTGMNMDKAWMLPVPDAMDAYFADTLKEYMMQSPVGSLPSEIRTLLDLPKSSRIEWYRQKNLEMQDGQHD